MAGKLIAVVFGLVALLPGAAQIVEDAKKSDSVVWPETAVEPDRLEWGQGALEQLFLVNLRLFLERDPYDFREFERVFGVILEIHPKGGPYQDGSWSVRSANRVPLPFGAENSSHTVGAGVSGASYFFIPNRGEKYLRLELFKLSQKDWATGKLPCIQVSHFVESFTGTSWQRRQVFENVTSVPIWIGDEYRYKQNQKDEIRISIDPRAHTCMPRIYVLLPKMLMYPANEK